MSHKNLYFLRHAVAMDRTEWKGIEEERPLTEEGIRKMIREAKGMKKFPFEALLSSPLKRAVETAELVSRHSSRNLRLEIEESLRPGTPLKALLKRLKEREEENILLVGHEPSLSSWIRTLLALPNPGSLKMKKGSLCHLRVDLQSPAPGELVALLPPRALRTMGGSS